jgi:integrase
MKGHIRRRGERSWELKFDRGRDPVSGKRKIAYQSFKGTKREAQIKLAELVTATNQGSYVEPAKVTVADFVRARIDQWEAAPDGITARTAQRYRQLAEYQITPHLGAKTLQRLTRLEIEAWHNALHQSGLAAGTIGNAHRVLHRALGDAEADGLVVKNVCRVHGAPKPATHETVIVQDVPSFISKIRDTRLYVPALLALVGGLRLGEVLALRDRHVDLDRKVLYVREAIEDTKAHGIRFKAPKSRAGRRDITLPGIAVAALSEHRRQLLETRMRLGAGKLPEDALLFATLDGRPLQLRSISSAWGKIAESIGLPDVTFHTLRHTHASQLIEAGVDIVTISRRLGHAKPDITLRVYAHMFKKDDSKAAAAINAALDVR